MTRNPLKWHPRTCPELEFFGKRYHVELDITRHPTKWIMRQIAGGSWEYAHQVPTWSGEWQRRFLLAEGFTEEEITAATCLARMMGETI